MLKLAGLVLFIGTFLGILISYLKGKKKRKSSKSKKRSKKNRERRKKRVKLSEHEILKPLQQEVVSFEKAVDKNQNGSIGSNVILREQFIGLKELNEQINKETLNSTQVLNGDNKTHMDLSEFILKLVLEKSGLKEDQEYFIPQNNATSVEERALTDVILNLPDSKNMIIDSEISLDSFDRYKNEDDKELKSKFLKDYIKSIKRHIEEISEKKYQDIYEIESPDFVLLFIPFEPAFTIIINEDNEVYNWAFSNNVVIVTPTILLATLRTIDSMWNNDKQQQNAIEIASQAGSLYDQFVNLTDDLVRVGNQLNNVNESYDSAMEMLTGKNNLITRVEKLKKLGSKSETQIS